MPILLFRLYGLVVPYLWLPYVWLYDLCLFLRTLLQSAFAVNSRVCALGAPAGCETPATSQGVPSSRSIRQMTAFHSRKICLMH
jgi:hypothetical protein